MEATEVSLAEEALAREGRMRQLEAENLRLRFRVADLEGQVRFKSTAYVGVCFGWVIATIGGGVGYSYNACHNILATGLF